MCASDVHPSVRVQQIYVKFHFQRTYKRTIVRFVAEKRRKKIQNGSGRQLAENEFTTCRFEKRWISARLTRNAGQTRYECMIFTHWAVQIQPSELAGIGASARDFASSFITSDFKVRGKRIVNFQVEIPSQWMHEFMKWNVEILHAIEILFFPIRSVRKLPGIRSMSNSGN